jgi:hypothetical protein
MLVYTSKKALYCETCKQDFDPQYEQMFQISGGYHCCEDCLLKSVKIELEQNKKYKQDKSILITEVKYE